MDHTKRISLWFWFFIEIHQISIIYLFICKVSLKVHNIINSLTIHFMSQTGRRFKLNAHKLTLHPFESIKGFEC